MKTEQIIRGAMASVLTLSVLAAGGHAFAATGDAGARYGSKASGSPSRTIVIDNGTRHINVTRLETAALRVGNGDESTTWTFDTLGTRSFPLSRIIPSAEGVTVYVEESPLYRGN